jgi:hypothetical protein
LCLEDKWFVFLLFQLLGQVSQGLSWSSNC